jgi:ribonucleoside-diphosphate reductase alpha chain
MNHGDQMDLYNAIYNLEVMPSMRAMMTAGPALDRCNVAAYNCAYLPVDSLRSFDEGMYILMCGTGVGFSVENKYVNQLPRIAEEFNDSDTVIVVGDSKEGWSRSFRELISLLVGGQRPKWDVSKVRPEGSRLKTFGGRASGPGPLVDLFSFATKLFENAAGRRLTSLECHDLMCKVGDVVVVGGVRRSAMISLFDCTDDRMSTSKTGAWWEKDGIRRLANNSAVYENRKPDVGFFMKKWNELYASHAGEPGIFSRDAAQRVAARNGRRDSDHDFGTNPCSEIILRPFQFCNLTEVVVRADDSLESLSRKTRLATILGTIQSTLTDFKYLRAIWKRNCDEERLLGVSLTGILDNPGILNEETLNALRGVAIETNKEWAERLGIPQSAAITCVKPSGTVSQLVDSASGLHPRHSNFYLRTVRADNKDPLTAFLKDAGVYHEPDVMAPEATSVFYFPVRAPENAVTRDKLTAIDLLEVWKKLQENYCEHKPSATIYVKEDEWMEVGAWVYENFDILSGVAFLPYDGGNYKQAPYQEITKDEFTTFVRDHPEPVIDWSDLSFYETEDMTTGSQEFACQGGVCDIIAIGDVKDG